MRTDLIRGQLTSYLVRTFPLARERGIGVDDPLLGRGIIDSLGVLNIVGYLESQFQISISDEDLSPENFETIRCLTAFVEHKRAEAETQNGYHARGRS